jgi:RNA polymerase sigma-70 factor, ECF subfamily
VIRGSVPPEARRRAVSRGRGVAHSRRIADAALVRAALAGDPAPALAIVKRYLPLVRTILWRSVGESDLEDGVQEVLARSFQSLPRLRDPTALRSFIIGIALRVAATERRRRHRGWRECLTLSGCLPEPGALGVEIEAGQVAQRMRQILGRLKPDSIRVLYLRFVQEKELAEVAKSTGASVATAKRQLAKAAAHVRAMAQNEPVLSEYVRDARREVHVRERSEGADWKPGGSPR